MSTTCPIHLSTLVMVLDLGRNLLPLVVIDGLPCKTSIHQDALCAPTDPADQQLLDLV